MRKRLISPIKTAKTQRIKRSDKQRCMPDVYIPYAMLHASPITFLFCSIPVTLHLHDEQTSVVSVSAGYKLSEACLSHHVRVGTCFTLEYKGAECDVRIGRRIMALEGDSHTLL